MQLKYIMDLLRKFEIFEADDEKRLSLLVIHFILTFQIGRYIYLNQQN